MIMVRLASLQSRSPRLPQNLPFPLAPIPLPETCVSGETHWARLPLAAPAAASQTAAKGAPSVWQKKHLNAATRSKDHAFD